MEFVDGKVSGPETAKNPSREFHLVLKACVLSKQREGEMACARERHSETSDACLVLPTRV